MMQFPGRFLILTCLAIAAVFVLQSSPADASGEPVVLTTWGCHWDVVIDDEIVGTGDVHGISLKKNAKPAAFVAAADWADDNHPNESYEIRIGIPFEEEGVLPLGVEPEIAKTKRVTSGDQWIVRFRCLSRTGRTLVTDSSGSTFCEAYVESRNFVCENISNEIFGGACRCCYQVLQRPTCGCGSCCR